MKKKFLKKIAPYVCLLDWVPRYKYMGMKKHKDKAARAVFHWEYVRYGYWGKHIMQHLGFDEYL